MAQNMEHAQVNCTKVILVWEKKAIIFFFFWKYRDVKLSIFLSISAKRSR